MSRKVTYYKCDECSANWPSPSEAEECAERDRRVAEDGKVAEEARLLSDAFEWSSLSAKKRLALIAEAREKLGQAEAELEPETPSPRGSCIVVSPAKEDDDG